MLEKEKKEMESFSGPEGNSSERVAKALRGFQDVSDEVSSRASYNGFLSSIGNNHAGSYYPIILTAFPDLKAILSSGDRWPQHSVIECMIDLVASFSPSQEVFRGESLSKTMLGEILALEELIYAISADSDYAAASAKELLSLLEEEKESWS